MLSSIKIPVAYRQFLPYKDKPIPAPPYLIYYIGGETSLGADNKNLALKKRVSLELYTSVKDPQLEMIVEDAISEFKYDKYEDYINSEKMYMISYEFDVYEKIRRLAQ